MAIRILACTVLFLAAGFAQSPPAQAEGPRFDVVSIKPIPAPTPGDGTPYGLTVTAARIRGVNQLFGLLTRAFRVQPPQLDAPDFARSEFFEIQATLPATTTLDQVPEMLQTMLADRFKLAYHRETREYPMKVLTVSKGGMKLPRLAEGTPVKFSMRTLPDGVIENTQTGNVASLFGLMSSFGELQLVDETGLNGIYTWVQEIPAPTPGASYQDRLQESFQAMIEAAGLKLETRKVPKETVVVDHLEKVPTPN